MRRSLSLLLMTTMGGCAQSKADSKSYVAVTQGPLIYRGVFYGELQTLRSVNVYVPDLSSVQIVTIDSVVADGMPVNQGDVILTFVTDELEAELRNKETELAVAEAAYRREQEALSREHIELELNVKRQELALERAKLFVVEGVSFISKIDLQKAKLEVTRAELELKEAHKKLGSFSRKRAAHLESERLKVAAATEEVEKRRADLAKMKVTAPADGVMFVPYGRLNWVRSKAEPGVVARSGDKLVELPDLSAFVVKVPVRQKDATQIKMGDPAKVVPNARPDVVLTGKVAAKDSFAVTRNERLGTSSVEGNLKEVMVTVHLDEAPSYLRPGGTARVEIESEQVTEAVLLPLAALKEQEGKTLVELFGGEVREVTIGLSNAAFAQVLKGLAPGDRVALGGT